MSYNPDRDAFIITALCLHFGEGWEKRESIEIWEKKDEIKVMVLISETDTFFKFSYMRPVSSDKESIKMESKFIYLSKVGMVWDLNEEELYDLPDADEGKQNNMV